MSSLTLLGTGTCQLETKRMASSVLIDIDGLRIIFDIGRGITLRLTELGIKQDDITSIILSHYHPDHISDLIPYLQGGCWSRIDPRTKDLNIYGPIGLRVQIMRLISLFGPDEISRPTFNVNLHEIRSGSFKIGNLNFESCDLPPANNRGIGFVVNGKKIGLTGDAYYHQQSIDFLSGKDLAIIDSGHPTDDELIELAVVSQCKEIVCSHLYRELDAEVLNSKAKAKGYKGNFVIGSDLMKIEL